MKQRCLDEVNETYTPNIVTHFLHLFGRLLECHWTSLVLLARVIMPTQSRIRRCGFCLQSISHGDKCCKLSCGCVTCVDCLLAKHSLRGARQLVCPKCKCVVTSHQVFEGIDDVGRNVVYPRGDMHPIDELQLSPEATALRNYNGSGKIAVLYCCVTEKKVDKKKEAKLC